MNSEARILVLEPDDQLARAIMNALLEVAPDAIVDLADSLGQAQKSAGESHPDLFVLDVDATSDLGQEFLLDLRTSHPNARAIILTATHLTAARERTAALGAIHFLEKPFPHSDFVDLAQALLRPGAEQSEKFQGTLSELHIADIIQLKCMSGKTAAIEFTASDGQKARVYFEKGQVRHATAAGKEGMAAFNELMTWKGGTISEIPADNPARTIEVDWQVLLMEGARKLDEAGATTRRRRIEPHTHKRKVLVVDDSTMLLNFVRDILRGAYYDVATAASAAEGLKAAKKNTPDLILLDYVLPDGRGDEFVRMLTSNPKTAGVRVLYMSGLGSDLRPETTAYPNVIGVLNKPFTSDLLTKTVETHMPKSPDESDTTARAEEAAASSGAEKPAPMTSDASFMPQETATEPMSASAPPAEDEWWSAPQSAGAWPESAATAAAGFGSTSSEIDESKLPNESVTHGAFFSGDTRFFSLNWALRAIGQQQLSGALRLFWDRAPVDLLAERGEIVLATTRDADAYCTDSPITLTNVDPARIEAAREQQRGSGCPMFLVLAQEELILREPALQLVQHYGQKLFAQLWTAPRVRFMFEPGPLPDYARGLPREGDVDNWALTTLRTAQLQDLGTHADYDPASIPAYTKDGFERVQNLKLTVAEAQFASQFNGVRSIQQIAKNLRLDYKFARVTLFRFLALEIVECWPPTAQAKTERKGFLSRLGIGD